MRPFCVKEFFVADTISQRSLPEGISLREATDADVPEMIAMINAAFEEETLFVSAPRTHTAQMAQHFQKGRFLLAHEIGKLVASVYYELRGGRGYIGMLAVDPQHQRCGLGRAMMTAAEDVLRSHGCKLAELTVINFRTALIAAYGRLGYAETGVEEPPEELRRKLTVPAMLIRMEKEL
jgi:ribosomal protein S18 acetylase RimI-like enzyme